MKNISVTMGEDQKPRFERKTRMGGHLSTTLKKAGLAKLGMLSGAVGSG